MRDSMIFYRSFFEAVRELDSETKSQIYDAIFDYGMNFKEPELTGVAKTIWTLIKPNLDANIRKFENGSKGASHGSKGGRPTKKGQEDPKETPKKLLDNPKSTPNVDDDEDGNEDFDVNLETDFDIFWKAYDYNVGLRQTQDEWSIITKEMPSEIPKILINVPKYVVSKPDKKYRKKPENYLKERTWQDEILTKQSSVQIEQKDSLKSRGIAF